MGVILFEKMNLPIIKKTKTGYSTDAEVLDMLRHESPIVEKILAYRSVAKLVSTYCEGLAVLINDKTKRIHTTFNQMVTATGRLSSSDPNLQNIPVRTEKGREIRALFYPGAGYDTLVSADSVSYTHLSILHDGLGELIANQFKRDIIGCGLGDSISLLAKWMPSNNTSSKQKRSEAIILQSLLHLSAREYRKTLSRLREYLALSLIHI